MDVEIEELRAKLNILVKETNGKLNEGEVLTVSEKLDRLIDTYYKGELK